VTGAGRILLTNDQWVDIAIIGGGPAGSAAAMVLARAGVSVLLIDRGDGWARGIGESLPPMAAPLLRALGVWDQFLAAGHLPSHGNRSAWGTPEAEERDFLSHPEGVGWHLDRPRFDAMLVDAAVRAGASYARRTRLARRRRGAGGAWLLDLVVGGRETTVRAGAIVDASGRTAVLARAEGVPRAAYDRLVGVVGTLIPTDVEGDPAFDQDSLTLIEAVPDGWWYAARIPGGRLVVAHMTDADIAASRGVRSPSGWSASLADAPRIQERVRRHGYRLDAALRVVPADSSYLRDVGGDGWCAVGDAAAAHDPLSSFGITGALAGGEQAARAILVDGGSLHVGRGELNEYARRMRQTYAGYVAQWLGNYALERRWLGTPFWARRHGLLERLLRP